MQRDVELCLNLKNGICIYNIVWYMDDLSRFNTIHIAE